MKKKNILDAFGNIDYDMVEAAEKKRKKTAPAVCLKLGAVAACVCIVAVSLIFVPKLFKIGEAPPPIDELDNSNIGITSESNNGKTDITEDSNSETHGADISEDSSSQTDDTVISEDINVQPDGTDMSENSSSETDGTDLSETTDSDSSDTPHPNPGDIYDPEKYVSSYVMKRENGTKLEFNSFLTRPDGVDAVDGIYFESVADFQRGVIKDSVYEYQGYRELSIAEMEYIVKNFTREGELIPIVNDMYSLYVPKLPEGWTEGAEVYGLPGVEWYDGKNYKISVSNAQGLFGTLDILTAEDFESKLSAEVGTPLEVSEKFALGDKSVKIYSRLTDDETYDIVMYFDDESLVNSEKYIYSLSGYKTLPSANELLDSFGVQKQYTSDYRVVKVDGQNYLIVDSYNHSPSIYDDMRIAMGLMFPSIESFKYNVLNEKIDEWDIEDEFLFNNIYRDDIGIPIVDFDELYVPDLPDGWECKDEVEWWDGKEYEFDATKSNSTLEMYVMSKESFDERMLTAPIARTVEDGDKKIRIQGNTTSSTYYLYITDGDLNCRFTLYSPDGLPSDEELLSFGMRRLETVKISVLDKQNGEIKENTFLETEISAARVIIDELTAITESGGVVEKIADGDLGDALLSNLPDGTVWIELDGNIYRILPNLSDICRVDTHLGEGTAMNMSEALATALGDYLEYSPTNYYYGVYENGELTLEHKFESASNFILGESGVKIEKTENSQIVSLEAFGCWHSENIKFEKRCETLDGEVLYSETFSSYAFRHDYPDPCTYEFKGVNPTEDYYLYIIGDNTVIKILMKV